MAPGPGVCPSLPALGRSWLDGAFLLWPQKFCFPLSETGLPFRSVKRWFDRSFVLDLPPDAAPALLERLARTPDLAASALERVPPHVRVYKPEGRWSIQEHAGHLLDLDALWQARLDDYDRGTRILTPADLGNRRTHEAGHNERQPADLIAAFRTARTEIVSRLAAMSPVELERVAVHPRLNQPMTVAGFAAFIAEHDDHHLALMADIAAAVGTWPRCAIRLLEAVDAAQPWLAAVDDATSARRPGPGRWSPREVLGHLVDSASNNHQRFVRGQWQEGLVFDGYDQDAWVAAQGYQDTAWPNLVTLWSSYNRHLARVMAAAPAAVREAPRIAHNLDRLAYRPVPADQPATLAYFMDDYVDHLEHHLQQIRAQVSAGS